MKHDRNPDTGIGNSRADSDRLALRARIVSDSQRNRGAFADRIALAFAQRDAERRAYDRAATMRELSRVAVLRDIGLADLNDYRARLLSLDAGTGGRRLRWSGLHRVPSRGRARRATPPASVML